MTYATSPALALAPGTHTAPGTGANTGPRTGRPSTEPPDIFDPPPLDAAKAAFIRAKDGYLIVRDTGPTTPPDLLAATAADPHAYAAWLDRTGKVPVAALASRRLHHTV